ncbi:kinase-like domain-containing protein [Dendryphion nanum]|uniref:Kinase-like domain-containing protein n=1 Tax=Dendryphion nanum TaxID=256645 RepID=A0A9P9IZK3_9PLEO|nr:kinase-like domain-containing protein [Dendryphion nanum]
MSSVFTVFFTALAANSLLHVAAGPVDLHVTSKIVSVRDTTNSFNTLNIGDIITIRDAQIFQKRGINDEDNATTFDTFAIESRFISVSKRTDITPSHYMRSRFSKRADPPGWDEEDSYKCAGTRVMIDDKPIGAGGSGTIYGATRKDGLRVAMKGAQSGKELDHEWKMMQKIGDHKNVMKGYGRCLVEIMEYLMLELLEGGTLQAQITAQAYKGNELVTKTAIAQVFNGVMHMHDKGVAHQDLKGDNVMFDKSGVVKVIDFGLGTTETKVSKIDVAGGIRSIEAETGSTMEIDPFSNDTWELGVMLVHMLIGKKPWSNAAAANAKDIWNKPAPSQRSSACKKEWPDFTTDFCDVLAWVFVPQVSRKPLSWFAGQIVNPNLKLIDDCEKEGKKNTRRTANDGELIVVAVEDAGDEWVVRAVMP